MQYRYVFNLAQYMFRFSGKFKKVCTVNTTLKHIQKFHLIIHCKI